MMKIYAIDFDGVINNEGEPIQKNIDKISILYDNPKNLIIIYSAREESVDQITLVKKLLYQFKVKYHLVKLGKLRADYYIDDKNTTL